MGVRTIGHVTHVIASTTRTQSFSVTSCSYTYVFTATNGQQYPGESPQSSRAACRLKAGDWSTIRAIASKSKTVIYRSKQRLLIFMPWFNGTKTKKKGDSIAHSCSNKHLIDYHGAFLLNNGYSEIRCDCPGSTISYDMHQPSRNSPADDATLWPTIWCVASVGILFIMCTVVGLIAMITTRFRPPARP